MNDDTPSLRERQAQAVRDQLRAEFIRLLATRGPDGFSLADVSAAAGVSERTLYRYYPSRDALIDAVLAEDVARMDRAMAERVGEMRDLADPEMMAEAFAVFEEHAELVEATRLLHAAGLDRSASSSRTEQLRDRFAESIHPDALDQAVALFRALAGSATWARLREPDVAMDAREAGRTVQWALQVLVREAQQADGPLRPDPGWTL
jgi:AcrR family transcriptional regulator